MSLGRNDSSLTALSAYAEDSDAENEQDETGNDVIDNISGSDDETSQARKPEAAEPKGEKRDRSPVDLVEEVQKAPGSRKAMKLVSYEGDVDDEDEDDPSFEQDEDNSPDEHSENQNLVNYDISHNSETGAFSKQFLSSYDESLLPPEPPGKCSKRLQEKIAQFYEKVHKGHDINASIQRRKDFRNPSIFEKLLQFCDIDEKGTNYPPKLYDPTLYGKESYYDALAKAQKTEMDKREKEKKDRAKVEFVVGTAKKSGSSDLPATGEKRKSKWDSQPAIKPTAIHTLTSAPVISIAASGSGTKTTVISAVGNISKKTK